MTALCGYWLPSKPRFSFLARPIMAATHAYMYIVYAKDDGVGDLISLAIPLMSSIVTGPRCISRASRGQKNKSEDSFNARRRLSSAERGDTRRHDVTGISVFPQGKRLIFQPIGT